MGCLKVYLMFSAEIRSLEFYPCLLRKTQAADTQRVWNCQYTLCHLCCPHSPGGVRDPSQHIPFSPVQLIPVLPEPGHREPSPQSYTNLLSVCFAPLPPENAGMLQSPLSFGDPHWMLLQSLPLLPSPPCHPQSGNYAQSFLLF